VKEDDDPALVRRCRQGDRAAFEQLVRRYEKPIFNVALRMLHSGEDASDIAQTTFLKAFEHLEDYDPAYKFYSWIYRIAVNESLNALASRKPIEELSIEQADGSDGPEQHAQVEQLRRTIEIALAQIKPDLRMAIVLRHFMHLSYHDMSQVLDLPEKTVKSRLHGAREVLRARLMALRSDVS